MVLLTGLSGEGEELSAVGGICVRGFMWGLGLERWMKNTEFSPGFFRLIEGPIGIWGIGFTV